MLKINPRTYEGIAAALMSGIQESIDALSNVKVSIAQVDVDSANTFQHLHYTFVEHAPLLFESIRNTLCGIDRHVYSESFKHQLSGMSSPGKSGSQLYFSKDKMFILKSVNQEEFDFFRKVMLSYYKFLVHNPNTLITRFFGLYSIRLAETNLEVHFIVMENICPDDQPIEARYDLKGSTHGRSAGAHERHKKNPLLKDLDFKRRLLLGPARRHIFLTQLNKDSRWLADHNIMDYSVLLCISNPVKQQSAASSSGVKSNTTALAKMAANVGRLSVFKSEYGGGFGSTDEQDRKYHEVYYMGVIDILQSYNLRKKLETKFKGVFASTPESISCVDPLTYFNRFNKYFEKITGADGSRLSSDW
eukprot:CAMPEP_0201548788 /NCGR_PEP_ID=MMETSP0173_2-20130828/5299_1 /ASSEMBLY_ACC=CAM_ASM_000268 /TAXON_ID=218659 /ORGANISM="Vexillifera sp., Strain DIVA3 564/2" /LENGTH=360 /DNA_ID=CAMNT_0047958263 /DNA_START=293 /DNA_END=1372 /DNA_ORIENTATION=+